MRSSISRRRCSCSTSSAFRRATQAEERARDAVTSITDAPEEDIDVDPIFSDLDEPGESESGGETEAADPEVPTWISPPPAPEAPEPAEPMAEPAEPMPEPVASTSEPPTPATPPGGTLSINDASYEDLRNLGLSVTQTGRVLAFRERTKGFNSLDDLDRIPGFPRVFLDDLKSKLTL
jgi:hypothetical protein